MVIHASDTVNFLLKLGNNICKTFVVGVMVEVYE